MENDLDARKVAEHRSDTTKAKIAANTKISLDDLFSKIQAGDLKELGVIVKADTFGSVEAIRDSLVKLSTDKVKLKVIHTAAGGITESDVLLASASQAIIIGFNVRPETKARQLAEANHVEIKTYSIIYETIDDWLAGKEEGRAFLGSCRSAPNLQRAKNWYRCWLRGGGWQDGPQRQCALAA